MLKLEYLFGFGAVYILPAFFFAVFSGLFYVPDFFSLPIAQLNAGHFVAQTLWLTFGLAALAAFARSVEYDPFWPWRRSEREPLDKLTHHSH
mgnify:FL=1